MQGGGHGPEMLASPHWGHAQHTAGAEDGTSAQPCSRLMWLMEGQVNVASDGQAQGHQLGWLHQTRVGDLPKLRSSSALLGTGWMNTLLLAMICSDAHSSGAHASACMSFAICLQ